nr:hypothetical protein [Elizabethkingia bruuniana]
MKKWIIFKLISLLLLSVSCNGQQPNKKSSDIKNGVVGGGCDSCELMYIGMPEKIQSTNTSPGWDQKVRNWL